MSIQDATIFTTVRSGPVFKIQWEDEFRDRTFQAGYVRVMCLIGAVWFIYDFGSTCFSCADAGDRAGGSGVWILLTYILEPITGGILVVIAILHSRSKYRKLCVQNHETMRGSISILAYLTFTSIDLVLELRRARFQDPSNPHVLFEISFQNGGFPIRRCNDSDPVASWLRNKDYGSVGCSNLLLDGNTYGTLLLVCITPMILRMQPRSAVWIVLINSATFFSACLVVGTGFSAFVVPLLVQCATGLTTAYFCSLNERRSRAKFAIDKGIEFAARRNGDLLHTLIPRDVASRCQDADSRMLAADIPRVVIMFCTLQAQPEMQERFSEGVFGLMNDLFSDFDDEVKAARMFKYQHVGGPRPRPPARPLLARSRRPADPHAGRVAFGGDRGPGRPGPGRAGGSAASLARPARPVCSRRARPPRGGRALP